jgi:hypothetical protein
MYQSSSHSDNRIGTVGLHYVFSVIPISTYGTQPPSKLLPHTQPRRLHVGHHRGILNQDCGGFSHTILPPNPAEVPTIPYEYLFHPPLSDRLRPPAQRRAQGYCWGNLPWVPWATSYGPKDLRDDWFSLAANSWGDIHLVPGNDPHHSKQKRRGDQPKKN